MEQIARSATAAEIVYRIGAFVRGSKCKNSRLRPAGNRSCDLFKQQPFVAIYDRFHG